MAPPDKTDSPGQDLLTDTDDRGAGVGSIDWDRLTPPGGSPIQPQQLQEWPDPLPADDADHLATRKMLPARYVVREDEDEDDRYLSCLESANLRVRVVRGLSVSASAARKHPECTIFLDGVAQSEPFLDPQRRIYNLDHHEGCIRPFTLATCEQALVLILRGLDLGTGSWTIWANDPDLDTILAIWLLVNHGHLREEGSEVRRRMLPLVRLQGVIDAQGLELKELAALSDERMAECGAVIDRLRDEELRAKKEGRWASLDPLDYTVMVLRSIDELVYSARDFVGLNEVEELARIQIGPGRVALVCRSDKGIYEVEQVLRKQHGDRIGLIVLQRGLDAYTVRQVDPFLQQSLDRVFERLNLLDPNTRGTDRWGGSDDIGGSPRGAGTGLSATEIADACHWVFRPPSAKLKARAALTAVASGMLGCALALALVRHALPSGPPFALLEPVSWDAATLFFALVTGWAGALLAVTTRRSAKLAGWRWPQGWGTMLALAPLAALAAAGGGSWAPAHLDGTGAGPAAAIGPLEYATSLLLPLLAAVASELLLRGGCHAMLAQRFAIQRPGGRWRLSFPVAATAVLSAILTPLLLPMPPWLAPGLDLPTSWITAAWLASSLLMGLVCGMARERSGSLLAPIMLHGLAATLVWLVLSRIPFAALVGFGP